jgi:phage terminase large subunit GpA-like protein
VWDPHKRKWVKVHTRNEGLDITVYATAAGYHPALYGGVHKIKDPVWEKLEEILEPKEGSLFAPRPRQRSQRPKETHPNNEPPTTASRDGSRRGPIG